MKFLYGLFLFVILLSLGGCSTYKVYSSKGLTGCYYKPKFNDCAEKINFDIVISNDNEILSLSKYINPSDTMMFFGFSRSDFDKETTPIRNFLSWAKNNGLESKKITVSIASKGFIQGVVFGGRESKFEYEYIHTRGGEAMLVIHVNGSDSYYGFTYEATETLMFLIDQWYENKLIIPRIH